MLSDRMRDRLAALNRETPTMPIRRPTPKVIDDSLATSVDGQLPGQAMQNGWGSHWLIRRPLQELWPAWSQHWPRPLTQRDERRDLRHLRQVFPQRVVLLDLETCGFAGTAIFLAGLLHWHDQRMVLSQLWARSYAEERPLLNTLWDIVVHADVLVTFNGKSFDWPQVHDRSTLHHLGRRFEPDADGPASPGQPPDLWQLSDIRPELTHVDLLHHARRRWRHELPNCRLQTLERYICGRRRVGDLPGSEIPDAYHDYVRTGRTDQVNAILHHNALDLITLLQLSLLFL